MASNISIVAIIGTIMVVAIGIPITLMVMGTTETVFLSMNTSDASQAAFQTSMTNIYNVIPMLSLIIIALVAASVIGVFLAFMQ